MQSLLQKMSFYLCLRPMNNEDKMILSAAVGVRSVSRIRAHLSIVYVTYIIDKCAQMRETERTFYLSDYNVC